MLANILSWLVSGTHLQGTVAFGLAAAVSAYFAPRRLGQNDLKFFYTFSLLGGLGHHRQHSAAISGIQFSSRSGIGKLLHCRHVTPIGSPVSQPVTWSYRLRPTAASAPTSSETV